MKQTNLLKGLLAVVVLLCSTHLWAYDFEVDNIQYTVISLDELTAEVSGLSDEDVIEVVIPETVEYRSRVFTVTAMTSSVFGGNTTIESIYLPNTIVEIPTKAFQDCTSLSKVSMPESLEGIGSYAFYGCKALSAVALSESLLSIEDYTFYNCQSLNTIVIPNSVTEIGSYSFSGCTGLTEITIGSGITSIGSYSFSGCTGLTSVTIPNSVTEIGSYSFRGCTGLTEVTIGDGVTSISSYAFSECTGLTEVTIGSGVTSIGNYAFYKCTSLREIDLPNNVTELGKEAFVGCRSLESLQIGTGLNYVEEQDYRNSVSNHGNTDTYHYYCPLLWTDGPSQMKAIILKDAPSEFSVRGYGYQTTKGEPLFSNIDIEYYYIGRSLTDISSWSYTYWARWSNGKDIYEKTTHYITVGRPYWTIHTLEIGGCCYDVPYFYQAVEYLILDENVDTYTATNIYQNSLKSIMCKSATIPPVVSGTFNNSTYMDVVLYVPSGSKAIYEATDGWKDFWEIVEMDVNDMTPEYTAVDDIIVNRQANVIGNYTLDGTKVPQPQRGINIIRYSDGTARKVLMK